jgi:hypothetical protein
VARDRFVVQTLVTRSAADSFPGDEQASQTAAVSATTAACGVMRWAQQRNYPAAAW